MKTKCYDCNGSGRVKHYDGPGDCLTWFEYRVEVWLDAAGREGWELVSATEHFIYLKREVTP